MHSHCVYVYNFIIINFFFIENVRIALKVFSIVLNIFNLKIIPLNFFECILLILKKKGKFNVLYEHIDKLHRQLINYEKNKNFHNIENLSLDIRKLLEKYKKEKQF